MKRNPESDMREEYDFSGGVRGRHAARMTAEDRADLSRSAAIQDLQTWIGHSLLQVQVFEAALFAYLVLTEHDSPKQAGEKAAQVFDIGGPHGLNLVIAGLRDRGLSEESEEKLRHLVDERNWLVHRSGYESQTVGPGSERGLSLLERLEGISEEARALKLQIEQLIEQYLVRNGLSKPEINTRTNETVGLWLAA